jgi:hypothetical protein
MSFKAQWYRDKLAKKRQKGFRGYPVATVAFYGPDDKRASKVSVGIIANEGDEADPLERWFSDTSDVRTDLEVLGNILRFIEQHGAKTVASTNRIIGCPHEEGIDYPEGEKCPRCAFWANRDRWTGEVELPTVIGVTWYTEAEWARVKATAADPDRFEATFAEWEAMATESLLSLMRGGITLEKVFVSAEEFEAWRKASSKDNDASSRAEFVSERLRSQHGSGA